MVTEEEKRLKINKAISKRTEEILNNVKYGREIQISISETTETAPTIHYEITEICGVVKE